MKEPGKIDLHSFETILAGKLGKHRSEVITGPGFGVDVSLINLPNGLTMALTSDPLSLIPSLGLEESAWLSVHLMANDMATTGVAPMYAQFVLNLPVSLSAEDFSIYWNYIHEFCERIGVSITGGHTGSIEGQNSTIAGGGTMVAVAESGKMRVSKNARPGNLLLATKSCALSSASILAMSFPETVKNRAGAEVQKNVSEFFYQTSSLEDALIAVQAGKVTAMHDVTEGGLIGASFEMAKASGCGLMLQEESILVHPAVKEVCRLFDLDPKDCIGAGSMLMAVEKGSEGEIIRTLSLKNIACSVIGEFKEKQEGIKIHRTSGELESVHYRAVDPYWNAFFNAYKNNWK